MPSGPEKLWAVVEEKVAILFGPRRAGKTTLLKEFMKEEPTLALFVSGEDIIVQRYLSSHSVETLSTFVGASRLLILDEAQKVFDINLNLK
jgi:predicted AAA+ superfamily ATPase